ncbi:MoxR-like ATPase [Hespellia stercorisuis DSM 15480]|uniref:MoxR-like ATPase n=2 Tax=Hespellia stercorisuis TaxID=180311 RepID=A0A1M6MNP3_9FIRM|nr:MoxR-like ATPase [Hespellia stercorisuis DSM 15480]
MVIEKSEQIIREVGKVLVGKDDVVEKVLMTIYAGGHILLEDYPGVGKTTLALGFARTLGLDYKRIQFTSDTMPSDITGFSVYNKETGGFDYKAGAVDCQLFLGDEINRTSPKTQSALLEVMEEGSVTVDGITHKMQQPFICIATQNPVGSVGTQPLPDSQLDRFMVRLSIGYPNTQEQVDIIKQRQYNNPLDSIQKVISADDILEIQNFMSSIKMTDEVLLYMTRLCEATRDSSLVELGVSPRGVIALSQMSRARAVLKERTYVIPEDVQNVFLDVCAHRVILKPQARIEGVTARSLLTGILNQVEPPRLGTRRKERKK